MQATEFSLILTADTHSSKFKTLKYTLPLQPPKHYILNEADFCGFDLVVVIVVVLFLVIIIITKFYFNKQNLFFLNCLLVNTIQW